MTAADHIKPASDDVVPRMFAAATANPGQLMTVTLAEIGPDYPTGGHRLTFRVTAHPDRRGPGLTVVATTRHDPPTGPARVKQNVVTSDEAWALGVAYNRRRRARRGGGRS